MSVMTSEMARAARRFVRGPCHERVSVCVSPISLNTPTGLNPGDRFRIAFVTGTTTTDISSTDIASYNLFVNTAAGGATYNASAVTSGRSHRSGPSDASSAARRRHPA
jgi:hypothetical protein